jgi:multiple sugar transport system substrate-binding protein
MRTRTMAAALVAVGTLIAACSGTPAASPSTAPSGSSAPSTSQPTTAPSAEPVTLTYFTFSAAPDHLEDLDEIIQAFGEKHPEISIEVQTASYDEYWTKLQTAIAGGSAPDTFELNYENFVSYSSAGTLLDLTPLASGDAEFDAATFYPRAYEVFQADGKQYGLPETFSDVLLFYNKDLFDAASVEYPTADWTWEDERAAAEELTDKAAGVFGDFQPIQFFEFYKVLAQNGGSFFNADGTEATFNDAKGVEAATWLTGKVGTVMPTDAEMGGQDDTALFKAGKLAMWHNGIWQFAGLQDAAFEWDVQVEPGNTTKAHHFFANAVVASSTTEHPDAAWKWLTFLASSPEAVDVRLASNWELPAVADTSLFESYLEQTPPDSREVVFEALDDIVVPPVIEQQTQMQDIVSQALERAKLGQSSVQDALNEAAQQVNALLP